MKALVWHGRRDVRVETVPDPAIREPTDAIVPLPMMELFDRQIQIRMGQANVRRWVDDILPLLLDGDLLATEDIATHRLPLDDAPRAYELFQKKEDGAIKVVLTP